MRTSISVNSSSWWPLFLGARAKPLTDFSGSSLPANVAEVVPWMEASAIITRNASGLGMAGKKRRTTAPQGSPVVMARIRRCGEVWDAPRGTHRAGEIRHHIRAGWSLLAVELTLADAACQHQAGYGQRAPHTAFFFGLTVSYRFFPFLLSFSRLLFP